ncbi:MAG: hypothetical protein ACOCP4_00455 [Candidatus Woesearchaeota archaeon]
MNNFDFFNKGIILISIFFILMVGSVNSTELPQINITFDENVEQFVRFNPLADDSYSDYNDSWVDDYENQSHYNLTGRLVIENVNEDWTNGTLGNIWIEINNTEEIFSLNRSIETRNAIIYGYNGSHVNYSINSTGFFNNSIYNQSQVMIRISELNPGENVSFDYTINPNTIRPPLNFTTNYNKSKLLAGDSFRVFDEIQNVFDYNAYQRDCIYDIQVNQRAISYDEFISDGIWYNFTFPNTNFGGTDSSFVSRPNETTLIWDVNNGDCLYFGDQENISYDVLSPNDIPRTDNYDFLNTTIHYNIDSTISHMNIIDVKASSEKVDFNVTKEIYDIADETSRTNHNVTWRAWSNIYTDLQNISYNVTSISLWVSERNASYDLSTDPNSIGTNEGENLNVSFDWNGMHFDSRPDLSNCGIDHNLSSDSPIVTEEECYWYFNYTDVPTPIVWNTFEFSIINNDYYLFNETGDSNKAQIQSHSLTVDEDDRFVKEMYIIVDYWLELKKNVTSLGNDTYKIEVWVKNKGNRWTPDNATVSVFDLVPEEFELLTTMDDYSNTSIYSDDLSYVYGTQYDNYSISGGENYNGNLLKWAIAFDDTHYDINSSLAPGYETDWSDYNSTWYAKYYVRGEGEYDATELYIVGLDPELVEGAITDFLIELKSGIYSLNNQELSFMIAFLFSISIMFMVIFKN